MPHLICRIKLFKWVIYKVTVDNKMAPVNTALILWMMNGRKRRWKLLEHSLFIAAARRQIVLKALLLILIVLLHHNNAARVCYRSCRRLARPNTVLVDDGMAKLQQHSLKRLSEWLETPYKSNTFVNKAQAWKRNCNRGSNPSTWKGRLYLQHCQNDWSWTINCVNNSPQSTPSLSRGAWSLQ